MQGQLRPRVLQTAGLAALVALPREDPLGGLILDTCFIGLRTYAGT